MVRQETCSVACFRRDEDELELLKIERIDFAATDPTEIVVVFCATGFPATLFHHMFDTVRPTHVVARRLYWLVARDGKRASLAHGTFSKWRDQLLGHGEWSRHCEVRHKDLVLQNANAGVRN